MSDIQTIQSGQLYLISAPSGAGKTSLVLALLKKDAQIKLSVSHTTRTPRAGEENGVHYHFINQETFEDLVIAGRFLEHANVYGNLYGTNQDSVQEMLSNGFDVVLEIDWQGARQVERVLTDAISICIAPPSVQALRNRLEARGTDDITVIEERMSQTTEELSHLSDAKYVIINDNFGESVDALHAIFVANRQRYKRQEATLKTILSSI